MKLKNLKQMAEVKNLTENEAKSFLGVIILFVLEEKRMTIEELTKIRASVEQELERVDGKVSQSVKK